MDTVWLAPPWGKDEPKEVEATPALVARLMVAGWRQCDPPSAEGRKESVDD